jgi:NAD(P)-dependent dehydrogenase (short-subunit alcohol dehydrogenase family)
VTGGSSGVGENLCRILYGANARVYVAARSQEKMDSAISRIKTAYPDSKGTIEALKLDLADLTTIRASAEVFLSKESHLDVLWLNAGVMTPPDGSKTAQGYELQLGTNNLGHWLFVRYLHPLLKKTAETAPKNSVRVIWVSSSAAELVMNPPIDIDNLDYHKNEMPAVKYGRSKAGNAVHSCEFARRFKDEGIISLVSIGL